MWTPQVDAEPRHVPPRGTGMKNMNKETCTGVIFLCLLVLRSPERATAQVDFGAPTTYSVGTLPIAIVVGDFNGDSKQDIAVANSGSNDVSILLGKGDGTYQPAMNFPAGNNQQSIAIGDFNGDGKLDLALLQESTSGASNVGILLGKGDGTFQAPNTTALTAFAGRMVVADFNLDKKSDLAVSNYDPSCPPPSCLGVFLSNGDGTFQTAKEMVVPFAIRTLVAVDFNGDGKPDIAAGSPGQISILLGNGNGTFSQGATLMAPFHSPYSLLPADFNQDGKIDLLVGAGPNCAIKGCTPSIISVFLGNGSGTFQAAQLVAGGPSPGPYNPLVGDFNGDGNLDVAYVDPQLGQVIVLGNGNGTFSLAIPIGIGTTPSFAGDLNGDKLSDLVVIGPTANTVSVFLNTTPNFTLSAQPTSISTQAGQQVSSVTTLNAQNGFSESVTLSCAVTGPAPLPTCKVSPSPVTLGSTPATSTLTIAAPSLSSALALPKADGVGRSLCAAVLPFPALFTLLGLIARKSRKPRSLWLLGGSVVLFALLAGCGGGSGGGNSTPPQPQNYTVTVTAASGALQRSTTVALTVQ